MPSKTGIGYGVLTDRVYIGKQDPIKGMWTGKKDDITSDFINVMFQYIESNTVRTFGNGDGIDHNLIMHLECNADSIEKGIKMLQDYLKELKSKKS